MPSRKSPSQRDPMTRLGQSLRSVAPASMGGRVANAQQTRPAGAVPDRRAIPLGRIEPSGAVGGDIPVFDAATSTWRPRGVNDALSTVATFRGVRVTRTTNQDAPDSVGTVILWTVESFDTDNFFDPALPDRLTIPAGGAGKYQIIGIADFEQGSNQSNVRAMGLSVNGSNIVEPVSNAALAVHHGMFAPAMTALAAGDVITLAVYQNSSVTLPVSVTYTPPSLSLTYLGA